MTSLFLWLERGVGCFSQSLSLWSFLNWILLDAQFLVHKEQNWSPAVLLFGPVPVPSPFPGLEGLIRRGDVLSFRPFHQAPQELPGALLFPVCLFRSLSHFFCMPMLYTSEVCVTGRWVGSFVTVVMKSLETVDRESIFSVPSPARGEHISVS